MMMRKFTEALAGGLSTGLHWGLNRGIRVFLVWAIIRVFGEPAVELPETLLADATLDQLSVAVFIPVFACLLLWGVLFHEDRK